MQGQGVLFGQIGVVFGIAIAGVWSATQWTAAALGYQLRLGLPWFDFLGTPVYHPWRLFEWWFFYDAYAPRIFDTGGAIAGGSGLVAVLVAIAMSVWRSRQSKLVTTYGSARWAEAADIRKAGLDNPGGGVCSSACIAANTCAINIQPTLTERPGLPVRIIVNRDLVLRPYQPMFFNWGLQDEHDASCG